MMITTVTYYYTNQSLPHRSDTKNSHSDQTRTICIYASVKMSAWGVDLDIEVYKFTKLRSKKVTLQIRFYHYTILKKSLLTY